VELAQQLKDKGHRIIFATLDTPAETCIERVLARRAAKGNTKPFNPKLTLDKWETIKKTHEQLAADGWDCRMLSGDNALPQLLAWFQETTISREYEGNITAAMLARDVYKRDLADGAAKIRKGV
jgi:hypothetical protein